MPDIIICANFGVKRLRDLGNTGGQILRFPIEMAGHPYNSAPLPRSLWLIFNVMRYINSCFTYYVTYLMTAV